MNATPLDQIVEYKHNIIKRLRNSEDLIALLADDPDIDMDSDEAYDIQDNSFYGYSYSDDTFQSDRAVIFVEVIVNRRPNLEFQGLQIQIQVICNKGFVPLDQKKFRGIVGNRRDIICCVISDLLEGEDDFGLGDLMLTDAEPISAPNGFSGYGLIFDAIDFATKDGRYDYR